MTIAEALGQPGASHQRQTQRLQPRLQALAPRAREAAERLGCAASGAAVSPPLCRYVGRDHRRSISTERGMEEQQGAPTAMRHTVLVHRQAIYTPQLEVIGYLLDCQRS